jgi:hypothetical protein
MTVSWEAHQGLDYTVVMQVHEGTDNASIKISTGDAAKDLALAETVANLLNCLQHPMVKYTGIDPVYVTGTLPVSHGAHAVTAVYDSRHKTLSMFEIVR